MLWTLQREHFAYVIDHSGGHLLHSPTRWSNRRIPGLVVFGTMGTQGIEAIHPGPAATSATMRDAMRALLDLENVTYDGSITVPTQLRAHIAASVQVAVANVVDRYGCFGTENHITGKLFADLHDDWAAEGWTVRVRAQQYSPNVKEPKLGADVGILIDIRDGACRRVVKVAWLQAKRVDVLREEPWHDPDLDEQMLRMRARTSDAYAIFYAATGTEVRGGPELQDRWSLDAWLDSVVECSRGDRSIDVVLDTFDRAQVLTLTIDHATA